jgi:hypothetical protein
MSKIKPEEMVSKMMSEISPEMLSGLAGGDGLDLGNIGSLVSSVAGLTSGSSSAPSSAVQEEKELTPEQLKELEEYYSNIKVDSQPELD